MSRALIARCRSAFVPFGAHSSMIVANIQGPDTLSLEGTSSSPMEWAANVERPTNVGNTKRTTNGSK